MKPGRIYEREIKKQILTYLRYNGIYAWNNRNTGLFNPKSGSFIPAVMKGIPDILGYLGTRWGQHAGRFVCVEVKAEGGKATAAQELFVKEAKDNGCVSLIAYDIKDVARVLDELDKTK